jgi:Cu2+-exporting ATPase
MDFPVALRMLITFVVSIAGTFKLQGLFGREVYFDSLAIFVFFLLTGRWLDLRLHDRTAGVLGVLINRLPDSAARLEAPDNYMSIALRRLGVSDVIRILPGETFPAGGVLLQGDMLVDEALLTGESNPMARGVGGAVIAGSHNLSQTVLVRVECLGEKTRFAQIVVLVASAATSKLALATIRAGVQHEP